MVHGLFPVAYRHGPFLRCGLDSKTYHFGSRFITRKEFACFHRFANNAIQRLNRIRGMDHLADIGRKIKERNQVGPVIASGLAYLRIFFIPGSSGEKGTRGTPNAKCRKCYS